MASQTRSALRWHRLVAGAAICAGLTGAITTAAPAFADPADPPTPATPTAPAAGTPGLALTGGAAGGTPTAPGAGAAAPGGTAAAPAPATSYVYVLDRLAQEFSRGSSAGQVANRLNRVLTLREQGYRPRPANLMAVQASLEKRPNQSPLIAALQSTLAYQQKLQAQGGGGSGQQQPSGPGVGINQGDWTPGNPMQRDDPVFPMPGRG